MKEYVAFDIESTGLVPFQERMIEIAAIRFSLGPEGYREIAVFQELADPKMPIPEAASKVHRIYDADVSGKPEAKEVLARFVEFVGTDSILVAHNAEFDRDFVGAELLLAGLPFPKNSVLDTLAMSRSLVQGIMNHRLETLVHHFGLPVRDFHRALDDARYLGQLCAHFARLAGGHDGLLRHSPVLVFQDVLRLLDVRLGLAQAPIGQALKKQCVLAFEYEDGGQKKPLRIRPLQVFKAEKTDSVLGVLIDSGQTKSFRLDRISKPRCEIS